MIKILGRPSVKRYMRNPYHIDNPYGASY